MTLSRHEYDTGAVRSGDCQNVRYDLISPIGLEAAARAYAEGAEKFGYCNWENGMPVTDLLNHALAHIFKFLGGDRSEDHLGHATWNLLGASHSYALWPELNQDLLRGENCKAPPVAAKTQPGKKPARASGVAPAANAAADLTVASDLTALRAAVCGHR